MSKAITARPFPILRPNAGEQAGVARKVGLIGDVHAEHVRLETAIMALLHAGADELLCTGDICDGPGDIERCVDLIEEHNIKCVRGNHDRWMLDNRVRHLKDAHVRDNLSDRTISFLSTLPTQRNIQTAAGRLLLCHGILDNDLGKVWPGSERMPPERSKGLDKLIRHGGYQLLVNGHMHYRIVLDYPGLTHINAGTLSPRHRPGVTLMNCDSNALEVFEFTPNPATSKGAENLITSNPRCLKPTKTEALKDPQRHQWADSAEFDSPTETDRLPLALYA